MDRVYHAMQSMTGALKGQPQTSMISHLANVCFGYTQLEGRWRATNRPLGSESGSFSKHWSNIRYKKSNEEVLVLNEM